MDQARGLSVLPPRGSVSLGLEQAGFAGVPDGSERLLSMNPNSQFLSSLHLRSQQQQQRKTRLCRPLPSQCCSGCQIGPPSEGSLASTIHGSRAPAVSLVQSSGAAPALSVRSLAAQKGAPVQQALATGRDHVHEPRTRSKSRRSARKERSRGASRGERSSEPRSGSRRAEGAGSGSGSSPLSLRNNTATQPTLPGAQHHLPGYSYYYSNGTNEGSGNLGDGSVSPTYYYYDSSPVTPAHSEWRGASCELPNGSRASGSATQGFERSGVWAERTADPAPKDESTWGMHGDDGASISTRKPLVARGSNSPFVTTSDVSSSTPYYGYESSPHMQTPASNTFARATEKPLSFSSTTGPSGTMTPPPNQIPTWMMLQSRRAQVTDPTRFVDGQIRATAVSFGPTGSTKAVSGRPSDSTGADTSSTTSAITRSVHRIVEQPTSGITTHKTCSPNTAVRTVPVTSAAPRIIQQHGSVAVTTTTQQQQPAGGQCTNFERPGETRVATNSWVMGSSTAPLNASIAEQSNRTSKTPLSDHNQVPASPRSGLPSGASVSSASLPYRDVNWIAGQGTTNKNISGAGAPPPWTGVTNGVELEATTMSGRSAEQMLGSPQLSLTGKSYTTTASTGFASRLGLASPLSQVLASSLQDPGSVTGAAQTAGSDPRRDDVVDWDMGDVSRTHSRAASAASNQPSVGEADMSPGVAPAAGSPASVAGSTKDGSEREGAAAGGGLVQREEPEAGARSETGAQRVAADSLVLGPSRIEGAQSSATSSECAFVLAGEAASVTLGPVTLEQQPGGSSDATAGNITAIAVTRSGAGESLSIEENGAGALAVELERQPVPAGATVTFTAAGDTVPGSSSSSSRVPDVATTTSVASLLSSVSTPGGYTPSRASHVLWEQRREIAASELTPAHRVLRREDRIHQLVKPRIVREDVTTERIIVVPETKLIDEVVEETERIQERVVEIARPVINEKIVEILEPDEVVIENTVQDIHRVEVETFELREVESVHECVNNVLTDVVKERVVEVPEIELKEVDVVKTVEVPSWRDEVVVKERPVNHYVSKPVPEISTVKVEQEVPRLVPVPIAQTTTIELKLPRILAVYETVKVPVYLPRFIEVPLPCDTVSPNFEARCLSFCEEVAQTAVTARLESVSLCRLESLGVEAKQRELAVAKALSQGTKRQAQRLLELWNAGKFEVRHEDSIATQSTEGDEDEDEEDDRGVAPADRTATVDSEWQGVRRRRRRAPQPTGPPPVSVSPRGAVRQLVTVADEEQPKPTRSPRASGLREAQLARQPVVYEEDELEEEDEDYEDDNDEEDDENDEAEDEDDEDGDDEDDEEEEEDENDGDGAAEEDDEDENNEDAAVVDDDEDENDDDDVAARVVEAVRAPGRPGRLRQNPYSERATTDHHFHAAPRVERGGAAPAARSLEPVGSKANIRRVRKHYRSAVH